MTTREVPVAAIRTPNRLRKADPARVEALAAMIAERRQLQPIRVIDEGETYRLVYGLHRLEATRLLGREVITADVRSPEEYRTEAEARLEEILENLGQSQLTALDRAVHLSAWKDVYEELHPDKRHGGRRPVKGSEAEGQVAKFAARFSATVQERVGLSERSIQLAVSIARRIAPVIRERIALTWLADHQQSLLQLADLTDRRQAEVVALILAEPPQARSVAEALDILDGRGAAPQPPTWARLTNGFARLPEAQRFAFLDSLPDDTIEAWLARRTAS